VSGHPFDLAIIGGGVVGCAIARDASGRGLSVFLCEQGDLGGGASSSTGRILAESASRSAPAGSRATRLQQDILLRNAPHVVQPLRLVRPLPGGPKAQLRRLGALARIGPRTILPGAGRIDLAEDSLEPDLQPRWRFAETFPTFTVDDARLVILNALDARARGARIEPRTRCVSARREGWFWKLTVESLDTGERSKVVARTLVNAAGAYVGEVLRSVVHRASMPDLRFVKRSWIMVGRLFVSAYAFPATQGTIFAIPYEHDFTLIGPAEVGYAGDPGSASVGLEDVETLLEAVNAYLLHPLTPASVAWTYAGLCVLRADGKPSPNGEIERDMPADMAPLISVFGARMATHRLLAELAVEALAEYLPVGRKWTADTPLPGGHFAVDGAADLVRALRAAYPFVAEVDAERMVRAYGTRAVSILTGARRIEDLGRQFGCGLSEAELTHLMKEEWAATAADVLWRRSKLGLRFTAAETAALDQWMRRTRSPAAAPAA
jgi:glycerol-3-phosphate dehydrogenase